MPMDRGTPDLVRHCVAAVADQYGGDVDKAFAICVAQLQKSGYLKAGTMELTAAGKKKEKEHEKEPDAKKKLKAYEDFLKAAKETRKAEKEETATESYERDFNLLKNPRNRTGLEDAPHTVARKYETVSKQESSMDAMRRLAGISTRYEDRVVSEAKAKKAAKTVYTLFIDGSERFGFHAADDKDAESKAKDWMLKKLGSYNRVKWEVRAEAPSSAGNIHDDWMESRLAEEKGYKCLECGKKFKTAKAAEKAMDNGCPKCGGSDIDLDESIASRMQALLAESDD
jgi:DNA-directed RNA polymerase subunit RPC12/RpoP